MTNREKKLWDILNKYGFSEWRKTRKCLFSDLTALISEHYYPKEFVLWSENNYDFAPFIENGIVKWVGESDEGQSFIYTTDELFNYWKENER